MQNINSVLFIYHYLCFLIIENTLISGGLALEFVLTKVKFIPVKKNINGEICDSKIKNLAEPR